MRLTVVCRRTQITVTTLAQLTITQNQLLQPAPATVFCKFSLQRRHISLCISYISLFWQTTTRAVNSADGHHVKSSAFSPPGAKIWHLRLLTTFKIVFSIRTFVVVGLY